MLKIQKLVVSPFMMNCYVLACDQSKDAIVVDAGDNASGIINFIQQEELNLKFLINTHAHVDHISAVGSIQKQLNVPFYMHKEESRNLAFLLETQEVYNFGDGLLPKVNEYLDSNNTYSFGEIEFQVLETPGHSPGSVCFLFDDHIFVGDTLFAGSIGRTDLPGGSSETIFHSLKEVLMKLDDNLEVHCGHGEDTTIGRERRTNPFLTGNYL